MAAKSLQLGWQRLLLGCRTHLYADRVCRMVPAHLERRKIHSTHKLLNDNEINITQNCIKQLKKILDGDEFLRIMIEGGGCSGFQYKFEIDTSLQEDDKTFSTEGGKIVIDIDSLKLIEGSTVDFQEELMKASFIVRKNPNAEKGCSCGSSFSIKI